MLPPPPQSPKMNTAPMQVDGMKELYEALQKSEAKPNLLTVAEFNQFTPLFRKDMNLSEHQISTLSNKYFAKFDLYKEITIIDNEIDKNIMVVLPPLLTQYRSLTNTENNISLVASNHALFHSNIPRYSSEAFSRLMIALRQEQQYNTEVIEDTTKKYAECLNQFYTKYPHLAKADMVKSEDVDTGVTEWDSE